VYNWAWDLLGKGNVSPMPKKKPDTTAVTQETVDSLKQEIVQLHNEAEDLKRQVYRLQLEKDVLEKAAEIFKKDEGVSLEKLINREKAIVIGALRSKYKLQELLDVFHMAKSSYCYQQAALNAPDKYADLRVKIRAVFDDSSSRYGYRRIHSSLKNEEVTVSEKVIRRLMQEEKLIVPNVKRKKYNSYKGEITPAVPNVIEAHTTVGRAGSRGWRMQALQDQCQKKAVLQTIPHVKASSDALKTRCSMDDSGKMSPSRNS